MSYRSLPRRLGATALSVLAAVSLSVVGLAGVASAGGSLTVSLTGTPGVGDVLTATPSGGTGPYTYAWYDCTSSVTGGSTTLPPSNCTISATSSNSPTHTVTAADVTGGAYITAAVTDSSATPLISDAPSVTATGETVSIGGTASAGQPLTATPTPSTSPTYAWYDCTAPVTAGYIATTPPANCTLSATSSNSATYALGAGDYGYYVTATAVLAPSTTYAVATSSPLVTEPGPAVQTNPTLAVTSVSLNAGTSTTSFTVTTLGNGFTNLYNYTATYQWYDCTSAVAADATTVPSGCTAITTNGTGSTYTFAASDAGQYVSVMVTVTNAAGSASLFATSVGPIVATAASASTYPTLSTTPTQAIATSLGTWSGSPNPTSFTVTWYRCVGAGPASPTTTQSSSCTTVIAGPTSYSTLTPSPMPSYTFTAADQNDSVVMGVAANNGVVSSYVAYSAASGVFTGSAPVVGVAPSVTGTAAVGSTLSANTGTWSGAPIPTTFTYAWYYCSASLSGQAQATATLSGTYATDCTSLSAFSSTYTVPVNAPNSTALSGKYLLAVVTASNGIGSSSYVTATTVALTGPSTSNQGTISVSVGSNGLATATPANFNGVPAPTSSSYAYSWYDCSTQAQNASSVPVASQAALSLTAYCHLSATSTNSATHSITAGDVANSSGGGLVVVASVTTLAGTVWVNSGSTDAVLAYAAPTNGSVTVTGSGSLAAPFTANATWTAEPAPSVTYQWYMCSSSVANRASVAGCGTVLATGPTFAPTTYSASYPYAVVVATASNYNASGVLIGTSTLYSNGTQLVPQSLVVTAYPSVSVTPSPTSVTTASTLSVANGVWQGVPAPTFSYQWYYCTTIVANPGTFASLPSTCFVIPGATGASYVPNGAYVGKYFVAVVNGSNGVTGGNLSVFSASTTAALVATLSITSISVTGTATVGSTLSAVSNVYSQTTYTTAYQWYACTSAVTAAASTPPYYCSVIPGATSSTFVPTTTQTGDFVTVLETVTSGTSVATGLAASTAQITTNIPGAPASVTAYAGIGQATVSWTTPTTGLAATSYTVTSSPGAFTCTASTLTCVVTGLLYGTSYTFSVTATNSYGTSAKSIASNAVSPSESVPSAPTAVSATAGVLSATVTWTAATQNGSTISLYTVTSSPGNLSCTTTTTSCTVTGLAANTPYTFTVSARNAVGAGPSSYVSAAVTPRPNTPNGPVGVSTKRGNHQLTVSWSAGTANGSTVSGYLVTATGGGSAKTCSTTGFSCVVSGLTNGIPYAISVVAQSPSGNSAAVNGPAMVPAGPPSAPSIYHSVRGAGVVIVYFRAPAQTNGAPVAYYQYLINGRWTVQPVKGRLVIVLRGLARHHAYIVRVRAVSVGGASGASNYVRVITL